LNSGSRQADSASMTLKAWSSNMLQVSSCWSYAHDKFEDEIFTENAQDWDEVVQRMANPNMTRFKAMSMDEQVETIEKSAQEALRAREEIRVVETTEAQRRGLFLTPEAHTRGFLLMEEAQRVIDQLQNDPRSHRDDEGSCRQPNRKPRRTKWPRADTD
jgi:hypothetical protein